MPQYEMVFILSPEVPEEQVESVMEKVTQSIAGRGGSVQEVERWGRRRLAYPIKSFVEGNYVLARFQVEPRAIAELEAQLRVSEEVIRHLVVRMERRQIQRLAEQAKEKEIEESQEAGEPKEEE
ncbi:MAG: 30S ribosomal protein S6 [Chloroflexi bacterium]|nr:30S ribosomal protein S6 [Chloroflexota bacterium]